MRAESLLKRHKQGRLGSAPNSAPDFTILSRSLRSLPLHRRLVDIAPWSGAYSPYVLELGFSHHAA